MFKLIYDDFRNKYEEFRKMLHGLAGNVGGSAGKGGWNEDQRGSGEKQRVPVARREASDFYAVSLRRTNRVMHLAVSPEETKYKSLAARRATGTAK